MTSFSAAESDIWSGIAKSKASLQNISKPAQNDTLFQLPAIPPQKPISQIHTSQTKSGAAQFLPPFSVEAQQSAREGSKNRGKRRQNAPQKRKRKSAADSRNTLRAPRVSSADSLKVKKCAAEHKERIDAALKRANVKFYVPSSVRAFVSRPATKDMGKYWYVLWQSVFALIEQDPKSTLPCAAHHLSVLYSARRALAPLLPDCRSDVPVNDGDENESHSKTDNDKGTQEIAFGAQSVNNAELATFYRSAVRRDVPNYFVDQTVCAALQKVLREESDVQGESASATVEAVHETCWSFIFAIVERFSDMFLSRSTLDANAMQLGLAQRVYEGVSGSNSGSGASFTWKNTSGFPESRFGTAQTPRDVRIAAVRDLLFHSFDQLASI